MRHCDRLQHLFASTLKLCFPRKRTPPPPPPFTKPLTLAGHLKLITEPTAPLQAIANLLHTPLLCSLSSLLYTEWRFHNTSWPPASFITCCPACFRLGWNRSGGFTSSPGGVFASNCRPIVEVKRQISGRSKCMSFLALN